jgi:hypothetical protein
VTRPNATVSSRREVVKRDQGGEERDELPGVPCWYIRWIWNPVTGTSAGGGEAQAAKGKVSKPPHKLSICCVSLPSNLGRGFNQLSAESSSSSPKSHAANSKNSKLHIPSPRTRPLKSLTRRVNQKDHAIVDWTLTPKIIDQACEPEGPRDCRGAAPPEQGSVRALQALLSMAALPLLSTPLSMRHLPREKVSIRPDSTHPSDICPSEPLTLRTL